METVAKELVKMFVADPGRASALLKELGGFVRLMPEVEALVDCAQPPEHHAEGDVWRHTQLALEALTSPGFSQAFHGERPDAEVAFAVLLHDIAKPRTFAVRDGRITFYGHPEEGARMARVICDRLSLSSHAGIVSHERVAELVRLHLFPYTVDLSSVRRTTLAKYFLKDRDFGRKLLMVAYADASAAVRADGTVDLEHIDRLRDAIAELEKAAGPDPMKALLTGEEIMAQAHLHPGPEVGALLDELREAQLSGEVGTHAEAIEFIRKRAVQS
jgi:poly(A) polymerase